MRAGLASFGLLIFQVIAADLQAASAANEGCVAVWATRLNEPHEFENRRTQFRISDQFVLCIRLDIDAYVSIWDAPPHGDVSRLYPNIATHRDNATVRAVKLSPSKQQCFGLPGTFPLFFPSEQGVGTGKLSVVVTTSLDSQPPLQAYKIPGETIAPAAKEQVSRNYRSAATCGDKIEEYLEYAISR
ncbi:hypothetical protein P0R31_17470 [Bradyrhizobium yuanmingense]|uniref:hypothetical protein n=1 Tax=Bradyrhizobium yuanmingense TaxID=108015 RepID=UPI0023B9E7FD|nr:hypothetical protein [Bradyrhizobium yuanmingense]MDF0519027.1 hypothetical protein [Bradyrhizobium yuanmingense]